MRLKSISLFVMFLFFTNKFYAQLPFDTINVNSVSALVNNNGFLFHSLLNSAPVYEFPKGGGNHLIFAGSFCFGGTNQNNELKLAADLFRQDTVFHFGPYSATNDYLDTGYINKYQTGLWKVSKADIIYHIDNHDQPFYQAPYGIENWPGNGDPNIGVAQQLAPYIDVNNNGVYEPHLGDYPCIKGDMAVYQIMHESTQFNANTLDHIGAEIHIMVYQETASNFIDSTTFVNVKLINRGQNSFTDFKTSFFLDGDIGFSDDDYVGSYPSKNLMYFYNGDNQDEGGNGAPGYQADPPALGLVSLNKTVQYSGVFNRPGLGYLSPTLDPISLADHWNYMNGRWLDSTVWTYGGGGYGGTTPTQHFYDGNPFQGTGWTEIDTDGLGASNDVGDRRIFMVSQDDSFFPGDTLQYDYAIIVNRRGDHIENVQGVIEYADSVQQYYDGVNQDCLQQGTGIQDNIPDPNGNPLLNFEITRLDGEGNMSLPVALSPETEQNILDSNVVQQIKYQRGKGPISARLTDTVNHAIGHFVLKFDPYSDVDSANWTIYHYDTLGGVLIDSVNSTSTIMVGDEQFVNQWGMAFKIKQMNYLCPYNFIGCPEREKIAEPIYSSLEFEDPNMSWLSGVEHTNVYSPTNWIMSGMNAYLPHIPANGVSNPACYNSNGHDSFNRFTNLANGVAAPSRMVRYGYCSLNPLATPSFVTNSQLGALITQQMGTSYQPSVDIVFTSDTSQWTRCPVIELSKDSQTAIGAGEAGILRQSQSVDKLGNPDGTGVGMGWFPGYAIDVETGRRLNMAFCENSSMLSENGGDMIWNPTENITDNNGQYVLGGQHTIYVFGAEKGIPNYDEGAYIQQKLSLQTIPEFLEVYKNLSWVIQPLLEPGMQLNATDARMKLRINKEFKTRMISNRNEGRPMFSWDVVPYQLLNSSNSAGTVNVYPNPATNQVTVVLQNINVSQIQLYSLTGALLENINLSPNLNTYAIDVSALQSGMYMIKVDNILKKLVIQ